MVSPKNIVFVIVIQTYTVLIYAIILPCPKLVLCSRVTFSMDFDFRWFSGGMKPKQFGNTSLQSLRIRKLIKLGLYPQFFLELITTQLRFYMVSPQLSLLIIPTMQSYKFYLNWDSIFCFQQRDPHLMKISQNLAKYLICTCCKIEIKPL